jgi:hypothetical protein
VSPHNQTIVSARDAAWWPTGSRMPALAPVPESRATSGASSLDGTRDVANTCTAGHVTLRVSEAPPTVGPSAGSSRAAHADPASPGFATGGGPASGGSSGSGAAPIGWSPPHGAGGWIAGAAPRQSSGNGAGWGRPLLSPPVVPPSAQPAATAAVHPSPASSTATASVMAMADVHWLPSLTDDQAAPASVGQYAVLQHDALPPGMLTSGDGSASGPTSTAAPSTHGMSARASAPSQQPQSATTSPRTATAATDRPSSDSSNSSDSDSSGRTSSGSSGRRRSGGGSGVRAKWLAAAGGGGDVMRLGAISGAGGRAGGGAAMSVSRDARGTGGGGGLRHSRCLSPAARPRVRGRHGGANVCRVTPPPHLPSPPPPPAGLGPAGDPRPDGVSGSAPPGQRQPRSAALTTCACRDERRPTATRPRCPPRDTAHSSGRAGEPSGCTGRCGGPRARGRYRGCYQRARCGGSS